MIQYEPVYLPVRIFTDRSELHRALELLHSYRITASVEQIPGSELFRILVQPLFVESAREILRHFDTESAWLIKKDSTILWAMLSMIAIMFPLLLLFPYQRDPINMMIFFVVSLVPGIYFGQKRVHYLCSMCGTVNRGGVAVCVHCGRKIDGVVERAGDIPVH